ncbi:MAG: helix-turn-helix transcriptional regulator [Sphingomonadales bacterium]|nr:helix-turn-helix transcriptional regulator [Sphingomonadales bacterium]
MITIGQIKAARAFLGLTQSELAEKANISLAALNNAERGIVVPHRATIQAIQLALESAGIEFIDENGGGPGVRLKKS